MGQDVTGVLRSVFIGIDVACGAGKRLPLCAAAAGPRLRPLALPAAVAALIPVGLGNRAIADPAPFEAPARAIAQALAGAREHGWSITRIAIDAPAIAPTTPGRISEEALQAAGISCFRTPAAAAWPPIIARCQAHLAQGGGPARLPFANMIWMLFGFALFRELRTALPGVEVIETYPQAIVRALLPEVAHKSSEDGYRAQLVAVAAATGWEPDALEGALKADVPGARHDRLDAFMAAWVASLPRERRYAFGPPNDLDDAIWTPLAPWPENALNPCP